MFMVLLHQYLDGLGVNMSELLETVAGLGMCGGHRRCTRQATYAVTIHPVNECTHGDKVHYMCPSCTAATGYRLNELIEETDGVTCATCDRVVMHLHQVMSVEFVRR